MWDTRRISGLGHATEKIGRIDSQKNRGRRETVVLLMVDEVFCQIHIKMKLLGRYIQFELHRKMKPVSISSLFVHFCLVCDFFLITLTLSALRMFSLRTKFACHIIVI